MFPVTSKILIIDDTALMRAMMRDFLKNMGYTKIVDAPDGEAAWAEIEKATRENNPFTLIISDWNMPVLSGLELLKRVRQSSKVPFIMLTAETEKEKVMEALREGVTSYITKPFTVQIVKEKLKTVYDKLYPASAGKDLKSKVG